MTANDHSLTQVYFLRLYKTEQISEVVPG